MASVREEALKRIEKKRAEIGLLEVQIKEATSYIQALEDMLKLLPREVAGFSPPETVTQTLRAGSVVAKARDAILKAGHPLHINEILTALEKPNDNTTRAAVSGSISAYFRKGEVFTRPAPNTFGLVEMPHNKTTKQGAHSTDGPPELFGIDVEEQDEDLDFLDEDEKEG